MAGGYSAAPGDSLDPFVEELRGLADRLSRLEAPTGTSLSNLVAQVKAAISTINEQVAIAIAETSYTRAQIDGRIASPGEISPTVVHAAGDVTAGGRVFSTGALVSPGSRATIVTNGYVSTWTDENGVIGYAPSTRGSKTDLEPMAADAIYNVHPYWGRYKSDDSDVPLRSFVIAEDVAAAGFGPDVAPIDDNGEPFTVNYSQLVPGLLAAVHDLNARLARLEE